MKKKLNKNYIFLLFFAIFLCSCTKNENTQNRGLSYAFSLKENFIVESRLLSIYKLKGKSDNYYVEIKNPIDSNLIFDSYLILNDSIDFDKNILTEIPDEVKVIYPPLQTIVITSSSHSSFLSEIGKMDNIIGATDLEFIKHPEIIRKEKNNEIINFGQGYQPNLELITEYKPQAVFLDYYSGINNNLLEKSNVNVIYTLDYMENTPLGRSEWIKFYGLLFDDYDKSDSIYRERKKSYLEIANKLKNTNNQPSVFLDRPYQGSWNISGGNSYISNLIKDAGAKYLWSDNDKTNNTPITFEAVLEKANEADFWLIRHYGDESLSYDNMMSEYKPFSYFKAFKDRNVWQNNTKSSTYYEDIVVNPHLILEDLGRIFHPEILKSSKKQYFQRLK